MLPLDFQWIPRYQYADGELALQVDDALCAAQLMRRLDGGWIATLAPYAERFGPWRFRQCSSFEAGKAGIEAWAVRHEALLREQALRAWQRRSRWVRQAARRGDDGRPLPPRGPAGGGAACIPARLPPVAGALRPAALVMAAA